MAKVKNPLMSLSAAGTLGNLLTFQTQNGQARCTMKPSTSQNAPQATRDKYRAACAAWQLLSDGQRSTWNNLGKALSLTGFNVFMRDAMRAAQPSRTYATLNPAAAGDSLQFSNGNLTAEKIYGSGGPAIVKASASKETGKWYWETTSPDATGQYTLSGIASAECDTTAATYLGSDANSYGYSAEGGSIFGKKHGEPDGAAWGDNDIIGNALDCDAHTLEFFKNGVSQTTIQVEAVAWFPAVSIYLEPHTATVNFGATAFAYAPPAGFNAGVYD